MDNSTFFVGTDRSIYRLTGYDAQRISTHAIEQALAGQDISKAYAFTYEDRGHKIAYFCFPTITFGYDAATQKWHRRRSYGMERWRLAALVQWSGKWYGGDDSGNLYRLDWDYMLEGAAEHVSQFTTGVSHANGNRQLYHGLKLELDTGGPSAIAATAVTLSIAGDVPDGQLGDPVTTAYTLTGGTGPYTVTLGSGFPPGLACSSVGAVTGAFTTLGSYRWNVLGRDATGLAASLVDTSIVSVALAPSDPIAYWKLDETSGTVATDSSGNGYHGTYIGGAVHATPITTGSTGSMQLTNSGMGVTVPVNSALNVGTLDTDWSICASCKLEDLGGSGIGHHIISNFASFAYGTTNFTLQTYPASFFPGMQFSNEAGTARVCASPTGMTLNQIIRIWGVRSGVNMYVYVNGTLVATNALSGTNTSLDAGNGIHIGCSTVNPASYYFTGRISDVAVYTRAVSAAQIAADAVKFTGL